MEADQLIKQFDAEDADYYDEDCLAEIREFIRANAATATGKWPLTDLLLRWENS